MSSPVVGDLLIISCLLLLAFMLTPLVLNCGRARVPETLYPLRGRWLRPFLGGAVGCLFLFLLFLLAGIR